VFLVVKIDVVILSQDKEIKRQEILPKRILTVYLCRKRAYIHKLQIHEFSGTEVLAIKLTSGNDTYRKF